MQRPAAVGSAARDGVQLHGVAIVLAHMITCQRLLPQQALRLAVELLVQLAGQQAGALDLLPPSDAMHHQAQPQDGHLRLRPPGRRTEVPPAPRTFGLVAGQHR